MRFSSASGQLVFCNTLTFFNSDCAPVKQADKLSTNAWMNFALKEANCFLTVSDRPLSATPWKVELRTVWSEPMTELLTEATIARPYIIFSDADFKVLSSNKIAHQCQGQMLSLSGMPGVQPTSLNFCWGEPVADLGF